ncbi:MAG: hypothetical protein KatS3mg050_2997 [Litorilinea sp.]|nr:MAG: hypothetical protein KatS3mg050_2997 [Litorilinea sp.]
MGHTVDEIRSELYALIRDLGKDGGLVSPSVYDTAQVLRFYPPKEGVDPALDWIISRQRADGGWGDPAVPLTRDVPTLAAVLALHQYRGQERSTQERIEAALTFLEHQQVYWQDPPIDALAVATELVLPRLLDEARHAGLPVSADWYRSLQPLRQMKLQRLQGRRLRAGDAPLYSWEALQTGFSVELLDSTGGVGHSPAATAAWLREAAVKAFRKKFVRSAERAILHQCQSGDIMRHPRCDADGMAYINLLSYLMG